MPVPSDSERRAAAERANASSDALEAESRARLEVRGALQRLAGAGVDLGERILARLILAALEGHWAKGGG